jgi:hypothetical protein
MQAGKSSPSSSSSTRKWLNPIFQNVTLERPGEDGLPEAYHVYMRTVDILRNPDARHQLLERAHREASEWQLRYKSLVELSEITGAMEIVLPKIKQKLGK